MMEQEQQGSVQCERRGWLAGRVATQRPCQLPRGIILAACPCTLGLPRMQCPKSLGARGTQHFSCSALQAAFRIPLPLSHLHSRGEVSFMTPVLRVIQLPPCGQDAGDLQAW